MRGEEPRPGHANGHGIDRHEPVRLLFDQFRYPGGHRAEDRDVDDLDPGGEVVTARALWGVLSSAPLRSSALMWSTAAVWLRKPK